MRLIAILFVAIGWSSGSVAAPPGDPYTWLLAKTGISSAVNSLPADILQAANRNASRCGNSPVQISMSSEILLQDIVDRLKRHPDVSVQDVRKLVDWYTSFTGRKVRKLERRELNEDELQKHIPDDDRLVEVIQIYTNTNTAAFVADVAAETEYAGWRISNCVQSAASSGDLKNLRRESMRGQLIRGESKTIRQLFERDILLEMEFVLSDLSDKEHSEYVEMTKKNSTLYFAIIESLIESIRSQVDEIKLSAIP